MRMYSLLTLLLVVQLFAFASAQKSKTSPQPTPSSKPQQSPSPQRPAPAGEEDVVRITTNLVQVDAVITDKNGKLVTDLRPEDVRILENGRSQTITHFSLITSGDEAGSRDNALPSATAKAIDRNASPVTPVTPGREQVRRTIAVVVDDLGLSSESIHFVRRSLKKFVDEQMEPTDLVAIIRTGGGMGALQQFTADKRMLYAAIEGVKWNLMSRTGPNAIGTIESNVIAGAVPPDREAEEEAFLANAAQVREAGITTGTFGALRYVVRGLEELPGRKSILLISDGISVADYDTREALQRLADFANRASVVIYTMDARGLQPLTLTAADKPRVTSAIRNNPRQIEGLLSTRRTRFNQSQDGLNYLALETGGLFVRNTNDLSAGIASVLDDQKGYYLIAYRPDESTFDPKKGGRKFHSLTLKVIRPGRFNVRMRKGFYGVAEEQSKAVAARTPQQQIVNALTSPFGASGVQIRLTSLFANDARLGSVLTSMLHVRATDLTFTDEADGWHRAEFDIVAITYGDNGIIVDQVGRTDSIKVRGDTYHHMLKEGFVYVVTVPIKKPGAYQLRAALRDHASERVGSASQFVQVPDIKIGRLFLSGVLLTAVDPTGLKKPEPGTTSAGSLFGANEAKEQPAEDPRFLDPTSGAALRRFHRGQVLQYGVVVYNAKLDKTTGRPHLRINVRLLRGPDSVFTGKPQEVNAVNALDLKRVSAGGGIQLGSALVPGEYVLQVMVTDLLADPKHRTATSWIDFEIVK